MATLIQSKQIEGVVTASVIQGDFQASGDISASIISASQIVGVKYGDVEGTPNFVGGSGITITQVGDTYTFTNTGGSGGVGDGVSDAASILQINAYTASNDLVIQRFEETTSSLQTQITTLSSSLSNIEVGTTDFSELTSVPQGIVSSSTQVFGGSDVVSGSVLRTLGGTGVLSGSKTDISHLNEFTTSIQSQVDELILSASTFITSETDSQTLTIVGDQLTLSGGNTITIPTGSSGGVSSWNELTDIPSGLVSGSYVESLPSGLVSSSDQVLGGSGILSGSHTDITSLNDYTSSTDSRLSNIESTTASLQSQIDGIVHTQIPEGTISSSAQITALGFISESVSGTSDFTQLTNVPSGLVSGSTQITDGSDIVSGSVLRTLDGTGVLSGSKTDISSLNTFTSSIQTEVDGLSSQTSSYLTELPSGLFSGSILPGDNVTIDSSSGDYIISASIVGGGDTSFNGDRAVTNTLLGDLFTESFNAGTSGSIQEFLDAVFFPSYAPTATFSTQTSNLNTNLTADGTVMEVISISDTVDDSPYVVTLTGEDAFRVVPTNADSSSWEIQSIARLSAGTFTYDITVTDTNGASRTYSGRTLEIQQANAGTLSKTGTFYIIESATTGPIYLGSNGRGGSQGGVSVSYSPNYGSQSARNFTSSNSLISVNSSTGVLSVGDPISGSGNLAGSTITSTISWEDQYGNTDSDTISVNVTQNNAPDITFTNSSRLNTNQAVDGGGTLVTISFNDTESDSINYDSFQFTDPSGQLTTTKSGGNYLVTANSDLSGSTTYSFTASIEDIHGFRSNTESSSFDIVQHGNGTLTGDTTMYIIESAVINDSFRDATGFGNGNVADVNVTYSPSAGSQTVQSFSSSNPSILIDSSGNMTLGVNLSGSVTQSGDTIETLITFQDQYGNIGSGSVTANIFGNNAPSVTFTATSDYDTDGATVGSNAGTVTISDTETNSPYNVTLSGTDGGKFNVVPQNSISSSWQVQPTGSLSSNTYSIDITVTDNYGESSTLSNKSIIVDEVVSGGTIYVYTLPIDGTYSNVTGITSNGSGTPPEPTFATTYGLFTSVVDSDTLGDSTITVAYGSNFTATLRGSASGNNVDDVLSTIGGVNIGGSPASERIFVFIPSGSEMSGVPTSLSIADAGGGSTSGEYIVYVSPDGTFQGTSSGLDNDIKSANIHKLTLDTAVDGFTDWYVIGTEDKFNNSNAYVRMVPSSGSIPS